MTLAAKASACNSAARAGRRRRCRNPPLCLPGTTGIAACCHGARRRATQRSLPGVALGNHAAADDGQGGRTLLCALPGALARCRGAGRGPARRGSQDLGGARLLRARPKPACLRAAPWSSDTAENFRKAKLRCARFPASAPIRRRRSPRSPHDAPATPVDGNVERVVARLFAVEAPLPAAKPEISPPRPRADAAAAHRRFRASHDGSRRHHLHAEEAGLRALPVERRLRGAHARRRRDVSAANAQARRRAAPRRRLRCAPRRRLFAGADAAGQGFARRHDRSADHAMGARFR